MYLCTFIISYVYFVPWTIVSILVLLTKLVFILIKQGKQCFNRWAVVKRTISKIKIALGFIFPCSIILLHYSLYVTFTLLHCQIPFPYIGIQHHYNIIAIALPKSNHCNVIKAAFWFNILVTLFTVYQIYIVVFHPFTFVLHISTIPLSLYYPNQTHVNVGKALKLILNWPRKDITSNWNTRLS